MNEITYSKYVKFIDISIVYEYSFKTMKRKDLKEMTKDEIHDAILEVFKEFVRYCEENNLRYVMAFGTLLGAIRHNGFIPWDLDMDVAMPRPDYDYFIKNYPSNKDFAIFSSETHENYFLPFAKLSNEKTLVDEHYKGFSKKPYGVYMDIVPVDGINEEDAQKIVIKSAKLLNRVTLCRFKPSLGFTFLENVGFILGNIACGWWPYKKIVKQAYDLAHLTSYEEANKIAFIAAGEKKLNLLDKSFFENTIDWDFEDMKCRIPRDYKSWLTERYGDYMTPPSEKDKRTIHDCNYYYWK